MAVTSLVYSKYFSELKEEAVKKRYVEKLKVAECLKDPYCYLESRSNISDAVEWNRWPDVTYADIYNYLVLTVSFYTQDQLKAYKSLDGYNFFTNGWVNSVTGLNVGKTNFLFLSTVKHSQSVSLPPLKVWLITKADGEVITGHCTCMAGLGEACAHVAAVLFAAEANSIMKRQFTSTSLPCSWLPPTFRSVKFAEIKAIDLSTPQHKRKLSASDESDDRSKKKKLDIDIQPPTEEQLKNHYSSIIKTRGKPSLLSLVPGMNLSFVPKYISGELPKPLTHLYDENALSLQFPELLQKCEEIYDGISVSVAQAKLVEEETRKQSNSKIWFDQRSGRVTASRLYSILHTNQSKPSVSLLKSICYPGSTKFYSKACSYGCQHEDTARSAYAEIMTQNHQSFILKQSGLLIDPANPFIGASPDGIVHCSCCGTGVLEIKCPYSCKEKPFDERAQERSFFLEAGASGDLVLKKEHAYYYQVQLQMKLCHGDYCDFVVWREDNLIRQRITFDSRFISKALQGIPAFVKACILPEIVGKYFTKPAKLSDDLDVASSSIVNQTVDNNHPSPSDDTPSGLCVVNDSHPADLNAESPALELDIAIVDTSLYDLDSDSPVAGTDDDQDQMTLRVNEDDLDSTSQDGPWCYCQQDRTDQMVGCDNKDCLIQWFHLPCLNLTVEQLPFGDWFCPECS